MRKWVTSAPEWCQVRLVEFPGYGYLSNVDDVEESSIPLCADRQDRPLCRKQLHMQRFEWIRSLDRQIKPLLYRNNGGFSFGALIAYELMVELQIATTLYATGNSPDRALCLWTRSAACCHLP
eukprot:scaffold1912_cov167-Amphora_coffeaeformis.AAC.30